MTKQEHIGREIQVAFDILRHVIDHPDDLKDIPDGAYVDSVAPDHVPLPVPSGESLVLFKSTKVLKRIRSAA